MSKPTFPICSYILTFKEAVSICEYASYSCNTFELGNPQSANCGSSDNSKNGFALIKVSLHSTGDVMIEIDENIAVSSSHNSVEIKVQTSPDMCELVHRRAQF